MKSFKHISKILSLVTLGLTPVTFVACSTHEQPFSEMTISGVDELYVHDKFHYTIVSEKKQEVEWSTDNSEIADISSTGDFIAKSAGTVVLTAKSIDNLNNLAVKKVRIYDKPTKVIAEVPSQINVGQKVNINIKFSPSTAKQDFVYNIDNSDIVSVGNNQICGLAKGKTNIKFASSAFENINCECEINVSASKPVSISINGEDKLKANTTCQYKIETLPKYSEDSVTWSLDGNEHATITQTGLLTTISEGQVTITAKSKVANDVVASKIVNIVPVSNLPKPTSVSIDDSRTSFVMSDGQIQFTAKFSPEQCDTSATWSVDKPELADIDPNTGLLTPKGKGDFNVIIQSTVVPEVKSMLRVGFGDHRVNVIGNGFYNDYNMSIIQGQTCHIRLVSKIYENRPIHRELLPENLEVMAYDTSTQSWVNIINECGLEHNIIAIPPSYTSNDIEIRLLGAEICEWITWGDIQAIASLPDKPEEGKKREAYKYFDVGDFKMAWVYDNDDNKTYNKITIADLYHFKKTVSDPEERDDITFTFMIEKFLVYGWFGIGGRDQPVGWTLGDIREHCQAVTISGISPTQCITHNNNSGWTLSDETFFPLSPSELNVAKPPYSKDGTTIAYFDESKYKWTKRRKERIWSIQYFEGKGPDSHGWRALRASTDVEYYILDDGPYPEREVFPSYAEFADDVIVFFCI